MLSGFKKFILRGNVVDMAVGIIIGAAFGAIVKSAVEDIITPFIGLLGGTPDFSSWKIQDSIMIGKFINAVINFLVQAAVVYFVIVVPVNKFLARMQKDEPAAPPPPPPEDVLLLREIRDLLKAKA